MRENRGEKLILKGCKSPAYQEETNGADQRVLGPKSNRQTTPANAQETMSTSIRTDLNSGLRILSSFGTHMMFLTGPLASVVTSVGTPVKIRCGCFPNRGQA
jgi:hypothetical protein